MIKMPYFFLLSLPFTVTAAPYPIVDTGQVLCYGNDSTSTTCPAEGATFYGQDAQYSKNSPSYTNNNDGTISDNVTGLMWSASPDLNGDGNIDANDMRSFANAQSEASTFNLAGYTDWRLPTLKELYSLINFSGATGTASPSSTSVPADAIPYINTTYFDFEYGDTASGLRYIDAQYWSSTEYVSTTMAGINSTAGNATAFGVNFADGRIKGYGTDYSVINDGRYVRYVRGGNNYGVNSFTDNGNNTISDTATELMWMQQDSGHLNAGTQGNGSVNWQEALAWCEGLSYAGYDDWRLPSAKELQSIVDYTRSPDTTASATIDPLFQVTTITDEDGKTNYPFYWTSTTHLDGPDFAVYIAFGEALGCMAPAGSSTTVVTDVHGAGAQRSDPKTSNSTIGCGNGPQGDVIRVYNHARCVRDLTLSDQTITFNALSDKTLGDEPFTVSATGGASGNPVTFTATGNCTVTASTVTLTNEGTCTITASQAGNADYQAAVDVSQTFNILAAATTTDPSTPPTTTDPVVTDPVPPTTDPGSTGTTSDPTTTPTTDPTTQPSEPPTVPSTPPTTETPSGETPTTPPAEEPPSTGDGTTSDQTTTPQDSATDTATGGPVRLQEANRPPIESFSTCPTDKHSRTQLSEGCDAEGRTIENLKISRGGSLANAVITGTITSDRGWIGNVTFEASAVLDGGYVTSSIINKGLMKNFEFRGKQIQGGTLAGTIILSSRIGNEIQEVMLAPGTVIQGKLGEGFVKTKLVGMITGDATEPAKLENVTIVAGTQLDNVILGEGVILEEGVIFGKNVKFSDGQEVSPSEDEEPITPTCDTPNALGMNAQGEEVNDAKACFKVEPGKQAVKISLQIDPAHVGQKSDLLLVIRDDANNQWHTFDKTQWKSWNGNLNSLKVKESFDTLPQTVELEIALGEFNELGDKLTLFIGYQLQDGLIVYNAGQSL